MNKTTALIVILVLILSIACIGLQKEPEIKMLNEILPVNPVNCIEDPIVFISKEGSKYVTLPQRECNDLFYALNNMTYALKTKVSSIENYGCIRFFADGKNMEILFSDTRGGSILINDVDTDGKEPVYTVSCGANNLKKLFLDTIPYE